MDTAFNEEIDQLQASSLRALASPHRVRLVHLLGGGPRDVGAISLALGMAQTATSQHLGALRAVGIVEAHRDGRTVTYRLTDPDVAIACGLMRAVLIRRLTRLGRAAAAVAPDAVAGRPVRAAATPTSRGSGSAQRSMEAAR